MLIVISQHLRMHAAELGKESIQRPVVSVEILGKELALLKSN